MELRGSCQMRLKLWHAVLFTALILVLGTFAHPRASQAGFNDDVEFVQPPSDSGDPDSGGPGGRYSITRFTAWFVAQTTRLAAARTSQSSMNRASTGTAPRQANKVQK